MRKLTLILMLAAMFATVIYAKRFTLTPSSIVPAAAGSADVGKDRNGNTELKLKVQHLAKPDALSPSQSTYVVWLQGKDSAPENKGELKVNGKLEGEFQTVTPLKSFDVFVTGENDATVKAPTGPEVMRGTASR